jgi:nitronate monooxygenase
MRLSKLAIKDFCLENCIFQGGMGAGFSLHPLVGAVAREGGMGIVSSAGLRTIVSLREKKELDTYTAVRIELEQARNLAGKGIVGINIMYALVNSFEDTVCASIDAGVDAIVCGAGLPVGLPKIKPPGHTALIPIVSSARALKIIVKFWERAGYRPDAVVLEGTEAGGHLGFDMDEIYNPEFALEKLLPPVLEVAHKHGDFPVIVAGGIYTHQDILKFLEMGASGVQIGTRFLATKECSATDEYKQAVVDARLEDIIVVSYPENTPASPCGMPFRILKTSPAYTTRRPARCDNGYVMRPRPDGIPYCPAMPKNPDNQKFFCICPELLASRLYTVGTNAYRVDKILSVAELMAELRGEINTT